MSRKSYHPLWRIDFRRFFRYNAFQVIRMKNETLQRIAASVNGFHLPRYNEIPNVGLYLEQTAKFITEYYAPLGEYGLTTSMISNYVKKGLLNNPVKKQYNREQIAYLLFIALAKNVLSLDALTNFIQIQKQTYPLEIAYNYFCDQLEEILRYTFELSDSISATDMDSSDEKRLLYSCVVAMTQNIYLEKCLEAAVAEKNA